MHLSAAGGYPIPLTLSCGVEIRIGRLGTLHFAQPGFPGLPWILVHRVFLYAQWIQNVEGHVPPHASWCWRRWLMLYWVHIILMVNFCYQNEKYTQFSHRNTIFFWHSFKVVLFVSYSVSCKISKQLSMYFHEIFGRSVLIQYRQMFIIIFTIIVTDREFCIKFIIAINSAESCLRYPRW